ncbi:peptidase, partial [Streptomyces sp. Z38]|nr:peptidase [Streptomyces sp. Z38]
MTQPPSFPPEYPEPTGGPAHPDAAQVPPGRPPVPGPRQPHIPPQEPPYPQPPQYPT